MKSILRFCLILLTFSLFLTSTACEIDAVFNGVEELAEGLDYEVNEDGETCTITGIGTCTAGNILIPATIDGYTVTHIGRHAFAYCDSLKRVTIPEGVTHILYDAFAGCHNLSSITLPDTLTYIETGAFSGSRGFKKLHIPKGVTTIEPRAFDGDSYNVNPFAYEGGFTEITVSEENPVYHSDGNCLIETQTNTLILGCKNSVIPDHVTTIGEFAFKDCSALSTITIPSNVKSIKEHAFLSCNRLKDVVLSEGVEEIQSGAFGFCFTLRSITIPSSVTCIGESAFNYCWALKDVVLSEGVKDIQGGAFSSCPSLKSIAIPASVTHIEGAAFSDCNRLEEITVSEGNTHYYSKQNCLIETETNTLIQGCKTGVIPEGITGIDSCAFIDCNDLASVDILEFLEGVGGSVAVAFDSLIRFDFMNIFGNVGNYNQSHHTSLTCLVLPETLTYIGGSAFSGCGKLESVVLPRSISSISSNAFSGCNSLNATYYCGNAEDWEAIVIEYGNEQLTANVYYYSELTPLNSGNYWHFVDGVPTPW